MNDKEKFEDLVNKLNQINDILKTHKEKLEAIEKIVYDIKHGESINGVSADSIAKFQRFQIDKIEKILHEDVPLFYMISNALAKTKFSGND